MPTVERQGQSLYFTDQGRGPCVVLGHSFLCRGEMWEFQVPRLAESYRVLNCDLRGHGESGEVGGPCEVADLVDDIIAVLDHVGVGRAVWAGLSIGGMVALRAALSCPERVAGLILLDTDAGADPAYRRVKYQTMALGARLFGLPALMAGITPLMFGRTSRREKRGLVERWEKIMGGTHVPSMVKILRALQGRESIVHRLPEIAVPALVMVGEEDRALPPSRSRSIAAGLVDAELVTIPQAGHLATLEQPEIVTGGMLEFLRRLYAPESSRITADTVR